MQFHRASFFAQAPTCLALLISILLVNTAPAQTYSIADGNSRAQVSLTTDRGMYAWTIDGVPQLYQQWFWYRVGANDPEAAINSIGAPTVTTNANSMTALYSNSQLSIGVDYVLRGGLAGSGTASLVESIRIHNSTSADLDLHFFQYSDFDLGGALNNDTVQLGRNLLSYFNEARQWNNGVSLTEQLDSVIVPGANHGEVAVFDSTYQRLIDGLPTTLNDSTGPLGPADVTWAFQWDFTIGAGQDEIISKTKTIQVPEPSLAALLGLGLLAAASRRR